MGRTRKQLRTHIARRLGRGRQWGTRPETKSKLRSFVELLAILVIFLVIGLYLAGPPGAGVAIIIVFTGAWLVRRRKTNAGPLKKTRT